MKAHCGKSYGQLAFVEDFAIRTRHGAWTIIIGRNGYSRANPQLDLSGLVTEEDHLTALKLLLSNVCLPANYGDMMDHYVKMDFMKCLKLFASVLSNPTLQIATSGLDNCNMAALRLAQSFGRSKDNTMPYYCQWPQYAFDMWQDIVFGSESLKIKPDSIHSIPRGQLKLLIKLSLKHKYQYTLQLIQSIATHNDYYELWLLKDLCIEDLYPTCALFMIALLCL